MQSLPSLAAPVLLALILWALSIWQAKRTQPLRLVVISASIVVVCIGLVAYGLFFSAALASRARLPIEVALQYALVPLFLTLPRTLATARTQVRVPFELCVRRVGGYWVQAGFKPSSSKALT